MTPSGPGTPRRHGSSGPTLVGSTTFGADGGVPRTNGSGNGHGNGHGGNDHGGGDGSSGGSPPPDPFAAPPPKPWYRRSTAIGAAAVLVIAGVAVVADLPTHATSAEHVATIATEVRAISTDVHPCTYAVGEAFKLYRKVTGGQLTATNRGRVPGYLRDDQQACSFTDQSVVNLGTITLPQTSAGQKLAGVVKSVLVWETSDGVGAIDDIQSLVTNPQDASAKADLAQRERRLAADRTATDRAMAQVNAALGGAHVRPPNLPRLPTPSS